MKLKLLLDAVDELIAQEKLDAERKNSSVSISLPAAGRKQKINLKCLDSVYEFSTVVAKVENVIGSHKKKTKRELQLQIWHRNALKPIVALHIDSEDQVIGRVTCTTTSMHTNEVGFYLQTLARDCDRFEYILSGLDTH